MKQVKLWVWSVGFCAGGSVAYLFDMFWFFVMMFGFAFFGINWIIHSFAKSEAEGRELLAEACIEKKKEMQREEVSELERELEKRR